MYKVHVKFSNNDRMVEKHTEATILAAMTRLTLGPAARGGLIKEVKVVDCWDCTNFLWQNGEIIFPTPRHIPGPE